MKQVIVVNQSLKLPKGKLAAQVAHGSLSAFLAASPAGQRTWLAEGMPKVVLGAPNAGALLHLNQQAQERGLPAGLVEDAGRTVVPAGALTCLGIGPAPDDEIDALTSSLKLL